MSFLTFLSRGLQPKLLLVALMVTGVLATAAGRGTLAYFTTQAASNTNTFTAGNLHFRIADDSSHSATSTNATNAVTISTTMSLTNMKPGDVVFAPIHLTNLGSVNAKWGVAYSTVADPTYTNLATALTLALVGRGSGTGTATNSDCKSGNSGGFGDSALWAERILATPEAMTNAGRTIVDSTWTTAPTTDGAYATTEAGASHFLPMHPSVTAANAATGDALADDVVCIRVEFPNDPTNNNWNGDTPVTYETNITLTFVGEQRVLSTETDV